VVDHVVAMHGYMLRAAGRSLSPPVGEGRLPTYRTARADVEAVLDDPAVAGIECDTPAGRTTVEGQIDGVVSADMPQHGWDLAKATGQDDTIDPDDVERLWSSTATIPAETMEMYRTPGAFGPGIEVFGPEFEVAGTPRSSTASSASSAATRRWTPH